MTIAQFIVAYAVCWWLVLFMVLPQGVEVEKTPGIGHVPSAPAKPRLRRKFGITTILAILPTLLIYFVATTAKAEESIYHASSGCAALETYMPAGDVATRDGYGVGGKKVASVNLGASTILEDMNHVDIPLHIPTEKYINKDNYNADLTESFADMGTLRVGMDSSTEINGRPVQNQSILSADCAAKMEEK